MNNWLRTFFTSTSFKVLAGLVAVGVLVYMVRLSSASPEQMYIVGERTVEQVVLLSGSVRAVGQVDLSFDSSGSVIATTASQGAVVTKGQILAELDHQALDADLLQARGKVQSAQSSVSLAQASVGKAEANLALVQAQNRGTDASIVSAETALAHTISDQATLVKNAYIDLLNNDLVAYPVDNYRNVTAPIVSGNYAGEKTGEYVLDFYNSEANTRYSARVSGLHEGTVSFDDFGMPTPLGIGGLYLTLPTSAQSEIYGSTDWVIPIPNTRSTAYQTKLGAYNKALQTQASAVSSAQTHLDTLRAQQASGDHIAITQAQEQQARAALAEARANLEQALGALAQAQAGVAKVEAQIENNIIRAPFDGTLARFDFKVGQSVTPGHVGSTIITDGDYELSMSIPEIDIAKVKLGDTAEIILDAYGTEVVWEGTLTEIELVETKIDGVPSYSSIITITNPDKRINIGMNARARIVVAKKDSVIAIPASYVKTNNGTNTVLVKVNPRQTQERIIQTGLRGTDHFVEVTDGLAQGETLLMPTNK